MDGGVGTAEEAGLLSIGVRWRLRLVECVLGEQPLIPVHKPDCLREDSRATIAAAPATYMRFIDAVLAVHMYCLKPFS